MHFTFNIVTDKAMKDLSPSLFLDPVDSQATPTGDLRLCFPIAVKAFRILFF